MNGISLLLTDANGVYIPQLFCQNFDLAQWGLDSERWDVQCCLLGPYEPEYWEAWDSILNRAEFTCDGHTYFLMQDGDLWAVCDELLTDEERRNFGFELLEEAA